MKTLEPISHKIFIGVMGAPYESELTTSLLRMVDAAVSSRHQVGVWACGGATMLTRQAVGEAKPCNLLDLGTERENASYPSTAQLVRHLVHSADGRLKWYVCRHCMEERGAEDQIPEIKVEAPFRFLHHLQWAESALVMGVK